MQIPGYKLQKMRRQPLSVISEPTSQNLEGLGIQTAALCEMTRQVLNRMDALIQAITSIPLTERDILARAAPVTGIDDLLIEYFRLSMASVPVTHEVLQVEGGSGAAITPVIRNTSERTIPFMLTNNDNALFLRWGADTLTVLNGAILKNETSVIITVSANSSIYAIFPVHTSTVSLSRLAIP